MGDSLAPPQVYVFQDYHDLRFGNLRPGTYMLPSVLFTEELTEKVNQLVRVRLAEHLLQEKLQSQSAPGFVGTPGNRQLQQELVQAMLNRAIKEIEVLKAVNDAD
ncbi:uncharacterized protein LACBIDRAFT_331050 [Laccaria bicolor S238N-H82]|uniref:Predicted protein n=1 Tax=Laccaria bicolor (strain S238N-H82 / ATCC MYA-4686) TaxID=486041 RepID=B0DNA1_LACBS|nr:uncharacterized protein LACBIDRAFT_331050 [Laccaria bicolor S238N-H82]EDR03833.1 predicted protein [Laccaria bicolor S238N-H82]|eukprot:XP_001885401.1 predicted protein [Laccaria bicolor S238N-H82]